MLLDHVVAKVAAERESPAAHGALERLDSLVPAHVRVADGRFVEALATQLAREVPAAVQAVLRRLVELDRRLLREAPVAERARERPLARVDHHVDLPPASDTSYQHLSARTGVTMMQVNSALHPSGVA